MSGRPSDDADVIVVGGGPVGLTLAIDLARRGIRVVVVEERPFDDTPNVKCNHISARSMEQFRRLGIVRPIRDAGLPADFPNDVVFRTSLTGIELTRIPIPSRAERYTSKEGPDTWWPTPEPPHRANQRFFEPVLRRYAASLPGLTLLNRRRATTLTQRDDRGVELSIEDAGAGAAGTSTTLRARHLVGCDGGSSMVRKQMGAKLEGTAVVQRVQSTFIRAPDLLARVPGKPAWSTYAVNPRRCGTVFAIDGRETWLVHNHLNPSEPDFDAVDRDASIRHILGVGPDFEYEVLSKEDWVGRRLVADRFRDRNVFIAGDAAHLWVPYAGYGMNAGIADATHLAWLLAARLQGWGAPGILDAYEAERQPITEQVSVFAMEHAQKMIRARQAVPDRIEEDSDVGRELRRQIGEESYRINVEQFCCAGLNFGYFYDRSPIVVYDGEKAPAYTMGSFTESTVPGCRAPHFRLADGRSVYDAFGPGYTLLRFDVGAPIDRLVAAARERQVPLEVVDVEAGVDVPAAYRHRLVLCRSDQHVAWRADAEPDDAATLWEVLRGARRVEAEDVSKSA